MQGKPDRSVRRIDRVLATQCCTWAPLPSVLHSVSPSFPLLICGVVDLNILPYSGSHHIEERTTISNCSTDDKNSNNPGGLEKLQSALILYAIFSFFLSRVYICNVWPRASASSHFYWLFNLHQHNDALNSSDCVPSNQKMMISYVRISTLLAQIQMSLKGKNKDVLTPNRSNSTSMAVISTFQLRLYSLTLRRCLHCLFMYRTKQCQ